MTNKERALTLIDELKDRGAINNREVGTLRRAILLNEQTEVKGDLISREWLRKASCKIELTADEAYHCTIGREKVLELIDNAPTVEPTGGEE